MIPDNLRTYTLKLTRGEVIKILLMLDSIEPISAYIRLNEKILHQFNEQDEKNGIK